MRSSGVNDFIVGRHMYQFGPQEYYLSGSHRMNGDRTLPIAWISDGLNCFASSNGRMNAMIFAVAPTLFCT
ncbi:MAG: hypothetical protein IPH21_18580 [Flavobacteriales bacterium]|nr:hypothetical protein [Flavobacteriales bacterium]